MFRLSTIAGLAFVLAAGSANAQILMEKNISMQIAMAAFQGAVAECKKSGSNDISVAVIDRAGQANHRRVQTRAKLVRWNADSQADRAKPPQHFSVVICDAD